MIRQGMAPFVMMLNANGVPGGIPAFYPNMQIPPGGIVHVPPGIQLPPGGVRMQYPLQQIAPPNAGGAPMFAIPMQQPTSQLQQQQQHPCIPPSMPKVPGGGVSAVAVAPSPAKLPLPSPSTVVLPDVAQE